MAQRYGGKFSPDGSAPDHDTPGGTTGARPKRNRFANAKRARAGGRVNLLFFAPLPLIWRAFGAGATGLALNLAALALLLLAAWMTREGIKAEEAFNARRIARRPAIPRKMMASALIGLGLALAAFAAHGAVVDAGIYMVIGAALHALAFGIDPLRDKTPEGVDTYQTDRVARAVQEGETHLSAMTAAIETTGNRALETRVAQFQTIARDLFRTVEDDPRDLTAARRYLGVYLIGARDATIKFSDLYQRAPSDAAQADFVALLTDLEQNFAARTRDLLTDDHSDLDIEIEVLRDRLAREGVRNTD